MMKFLENKKVFNDSSAIMKAPYEEIRSLYLKEMKKDNKEKFFGKKRDHIL